MSKHYPLITLLLCLVMYKQWFAECLSVKPVPPHTYWCLLLSIMQKVDLEFHTHNPLQTMHRDLTFAGCQVGDRRRRQAMLNWAFTNLTLWVIKHCQGAQLLLLKKYDNSDNTVITTVIYLAWHCLGLYWLWLYIHLNVPAPCYCERGEGECVLMCCGLSHHWTMEGCTGRRLQRRTVNIICFTVASHVACSTIIWSAPVWKLCPRYFKQEAVLSVAKYLRGLNLYGDGMQL